ncbi:MAG: NAD-dependent DNA ligase LigA [Candidatus Cardinium sp.]|uniref:NAD-dependent DNA ligase LigA n=1 Tax=Cardinium endosymbiont of Dermatophagoides farinae TaxID=2597823 RepID=UPI001181E74C|nr:NAD-dependent DNA ligase LigA [Cardinium endosymbiont of Dermatophagoides farinae]TSJ81229.1 NAD-dependent DNA ligase LigA [Cardinium endosymbiont of Dermatophagoides farinae]UWW97278.1 MAG: NAD-dependent DNA ligase LigA [Candidatus Cardinium sp.]
MEPSDISKEIKRLVDLVTHYNECYFQKGISEISDYAYDQLLERLIRLEEAYPHLKRPDSPTEGIGERPCFAAVDHQTPMLSLAKTYSEKEIAQFVTRIKKMVPDAAVDFICEPKIDGVALSILYEHGHLVRVVTRGDGRQGDDVTRNVIQSICLPQKIQDAPCASFEVRGEAFMSKAVFLALNSERQAAGAPLWANPRNITAGTLKTLDLDLVKARRLEFYGYSFYAASYSCATQAAALALLDRLGFAVPSTYKVCSSVGVIMDYIHYWAQHKKELPVDVDGIVVKVNNLDQQRMVGMTSKSPRWAIAYKYQPEMAHSILERVSFQVGRTGAVTPVAHFSPILLAGTMVRRASLHNADEIARRDLYLGDTIFIEKGGEIIPKVVGVDSTRRNKASKPILFIDACPACETPLHRTPGTAVYYCPNSQQCLPQLKATLLHFAHRKAMDIHTLGPKTIDALFEAKLVQNVADLYTLRYEAVSRLEGFQALSTRKLLANIQASKTKPFDRLLFGLAIKQVGETVAKKLALHFRSMERLQRATEAELLQLPDIGAKIATCIVAHLQDPYQQAILNRLQAAGLQFALPEAAPLPLDHLGDSIAKSQFSSLSASKKFVISGTFQKFTRVELTTCIEQAGGRVVSALSAKVDYLVAGAKAGPSKLAKARQWEIPILDENELIKMIQ